MVNFHEIWGIRRLWSGEEYIKFWKWSGTYFGYFIVRIFCMSFCYGNSFKNSRFINLLLQSTHRYCYLPTFPNQPLPSSRIYCSWLRGNCCRALTAANKQTFCYKTQGSLGARWSASMCSDQWYTVIINNNNKKFQLYQILTDLNILAF